MYYIEDDLVRLIAEESQNTRLKATVNYTLLMKSDRKYLHTTGIVQHCGLFPLGQMSMKSSLSFGVRPAA